MDEERRLILQQKALDELKRRIAQETYLTVTEVAEVRGVGRGTIETLPMAILPYEDFGTMKRSMRRYHPADVLALGARIRAWRHAEQHGEGEAYLRELREELEARDAAAVQVADELRAEVAW